MFQPRWLILAALCCALALHAEPKWIHMQTADFQMYSAADEGETRSALNYFERVRNFFLQMTGRTPANPLPVYIVMFNSTKEYEPYKPKEFALAYYTGNTDRDYIVLGKTGEQTAQAATHEYVHLVARHAGLRLPPWLNEGMAELYATLHPLGDSIEFGAPILGRVQALSREKWVPLATILTADHESAYYNETNKAGNLYNEGWALVQFLATSEEYRPGFDRVFQAIAGGAPSIETLEAVYGRPLAKIEADLKFHISSGSYRKLVTKMKLDSSKDKIAAAPANMFDVRLALANLTVKDDPRTRLEELSREDPKRPEPFAGLGYLALRDRDTKQALEHFSKAYELGDHSPKLLWDYGRLAERERPQDSLRALSELVKLEPDNLDARIELGGVHMNARQAVEALETIKPVTKVTAQQAQRMFYIMAAAQLQLGDRAEARATATRLQSIALSQEYKDRAADMLRYLDQTDRLAQSGQRLAPPQLSDPQAVQSSGEAGRPVTLRRREDLGRPEPAQAPTQTAVQGRIVTMECGEAPRMVVETEQGRKTFVAREPNRIVVTGQQPTTEGIRCGPQQTPIPVRILYDPMPAGAAGDGVVREMHFQ